jgi:hypothetical protein
MKKIKQQTVFTGFVLAVLAVTLAGCGLNATETPYLSEETSAVTDQPEVTEIAQEPTATATVPTVILVAPPDANLTTVSQTRTALEVLASESDLELVETDNLTPEMITPGVQIVVGVGTGVDLAALASNAPAVQFVVIDQPAATPSTNLSVIGDSVVDQQRQSFMAGYLTTLVSTDYKIAGLVASDMETTTVAINAFVIGARFFCGLCQPKYPPYNPFPQWETLPIGSGASAFQGVVDGFVNLGVEVIYVDSALVTGDLLSYLADSGLKIVGGASPDLPRNNWIGTVSLDPGTALTELWQDLMSSAGGRQVASSVTLTDTGSGLLSEGRTRLFEEMLADLEAGLVSPEPAP